MENDDLRESKLPKNLQEVADRYREAVRKEEERMARSAPQEGPGPVSPPAGSPEEEGPGPVLPPPDSPVPGGPGPEVPLRSGPIPGWPVAGGPGPAEPPYDGPPPHWQGVPRPPQERPGPEVPPAPPRPPYCAALGDEVYYALLELGVLYRFLGRIAPKNSDRMVLDAMRREVETAAAAVYEAKRGFGAEGHSPERYGGEKYRFRTYCAGLRYATRQTEQIIDKTARLIQCPEVDRVALIPAAAMLYKQTGQLRYLSRGCNSF